MPQLLVCTDSDLRPLCVALLMLGASGAWAESTPYYIGVSQALSHSSNLYNSPNGQEVPDIYSTTRLFVGVDQPIGRQRFYGDASVRADRYQDIRSLNNTGYGLNVGVDWATVEHWSGNAHVAANRSLAQYGGPDAPAITGKNIQDTQQWALTVRNGLTPHMALEGSAEHRSVNFSAPEYSAREYTQNVGGLGFRYYVADLLTLGMGVRSTKGTYPNLTPEDKTDRRDIDFTANWAASGLSKINARISSTRETHTDPGVADVSGVTGQIGWVYQPTGKLTFNTSLARDTGTETTFTTFSGDKTPLAVDNNRLTNSASLAVTYEITAKIRLNASARYSKTSSDSSGVSIDDSANGATLGLSWAPTRTVSLGCNAGRDKRTSTSNTVGSTYTTTIASCSAQLTLR